MEINDLLEIKEISGKGYGVVTRREIVAGQLLLKDSAIVSEQGWPPQGFTKVPQAVLEGFARQLLVAQQSSEVLRQLYAPRLEPPDRGGGENDATHLKRAMKQVQYNSFLIDVGECHKLALNSYISFFNHSCCPDAAVYDVQIGLTHVHAVRPLQCGEEVCITYRTELLYMPTIDRVTHLQESHLFTCKCRKCVLDSPEGEKLMQAPYTPSVITFEFCCELREEWQALESPTIEQGSEFVELLQGFLGPSGPAPGHWHRMQVLKCLGSILEFLLLKMDTIGINTSGDVTVPSTSSSPTQYFPLPR
mmetsp:Transcript_28767/g.51619  ORF Transcript_28767/g.51619 Transcript_28767/m.51619 type:complete len:305 (-) Transcript_28767:696-1610(-)